MSRGSRKIADVVELAWKKGARFDAWSEFFDEDAWKSAFEECGLSGEKEAQKQYELKDPLPWEHIGAGIDKQFLIEEYSRALEGEKTKDCTFDDKKCSKCAICWNLKCKNEIQGSRNFESSEVS